MNKDTKRGRERARERGGDVRAHTAGAFLCDLHKHVLNFGTVLQVIWKALREKKQEQANERKAMDVMHWRGSEYEWRRDVKDRKVEEEEYSV